jgi:tRNA nucleotidyltransferase/poly(A) polymerase
VFHASIPTKNNVIMNSLYAPLVLPDIQAIVNSFVAAGGSCYLVGGAVRDAVLGVPIKDIDIEVHGLLSEAVQKILQNFGTVHLVGKVFGVFKIDGIQADWSLPRVDAAGRKPEVTIDVRMAMVDALRRRDLTMNAMAINLATGEFIDPFHGREDMQAGILRATDTERFTEDPLRFYRVMQFISRFNMQPDAALNAVCKKMDIHAVSRERIEQEFEKMLMLSTAPSRGLRWLKKIGRLAEIFPELGALCDVPQNPKWHPEGDVFEHTMQALDAVYLENLDYALRRIVSYAALCHDLGKSSMTREVNGVIKSIGHDYAGVPVARVLLHRITREIDLVSAVCLLVEHHMAPGMFASQGAGPAAYKRLACKLTPLVNLRMLAYVAYADKRGRSVAGVPSSGPLPDVDLFIARAHELGILDGPEEPIISGRDLISVVAPGPLVGKLVQQAYDIQINESLCDKEVLLRRVLSKIK